MWRWQLLQERSGKLLLLITGHGDGCRCSGCVFGAAEREHEAEGILAVQVEAVEALLRDEAERGVQPEGGRVVELGLERDLEWESKKLRSDVSFFRSDSQVSGGENGGTWGEGKWKKVVCGRKGK